MPEALRSTQNPFYHAKPSQADQDNSVETLSRRGVNFLVCNNALHAFTQFIAAGERLEPADVYNDFLRNLVPGAVLVPAGVAAIVLAQEAGFTFLFG